MRDQDELRRRWSQLHHGIDPRSVPGLTAYLSLLWTGGRVLGRVGATPNAVTAGGVVLAAGAVGSARRRPLLAASCVVASAVCDGLDGAVAVVTDGATSSGRRADAVADRCCDVAFAMVLARRGAPRRAAAVSAGLAVGVDTLRRVVRRPAVITVAERPTFAICASSACVGGAIVRARWPAVLSVRVWTAAGVVGIVQLLRARRRPAQR